MGLTYFYREKVGAQGVLNLDSICDSWTRTMQYPPLLAEMQNAKQVGRAESLKLGGIIRVLAALVPLPILKMPQMVKLCWCSLRRGPLF